MKAFFITSLIFSSSLFAASSTVFMPLEAMGFTENFNLYSRPENRLNPTQPPRTNNFQLWQMKMQTGFGLTPTNRYNNPNFFTAFRTGSQFGILGVSGPGAMYPGNITIDFLLNGSATIGFVDPTMPFNGNPAYFGSTAENQTCNYLVPTSFFGYNIPTLNLEAALVDCIYSAVEVGSTGFNQNNIATTIDPYGQSLQVVYSLPGTGSITDYVVLGNFFHDVYYDNLTPAFLTGTSIANSMNITNVGVIDTMGNVTFQQVTINTGTTVTGTGFIFQFNNILPSSTNVPLFFLVYVENGGTPITFEIVGTFPVIAKASAPYTGWLRGTFLPLGEVPEILTTNTENAPTAGFPIMVPNTTPAQTTTFSFNQAWFTDLTVDMIAPQPFSFYALFPYQWIDKIILQTLAQTYNGTTFAWDGSFQGQYSLSPNGQTMALIAPFMAYSDGSFSLTTTSLFNNAVNYIQDLTTNADGWGTGAGAAVPRPPSPIGDSSASLFSTTFSLGFMGGYASGTGSNSIITFQQGLSANRPSYAAPPSAPYVYAQGATPSDIETNITTIVGRLNPYRSSIPTSCTCITYNNSGSTSSMMWQYSLASTTPVAGSSTTTPLITFPGWFKLDSTSSTLIPVRYATGIKGFIFTATAPMGSINFIEDYPWPAWMTSGNFLPTTSLSTLFGTNNASMQTLLGDLYTEEQYSWITGFPVAQWPNPDGNLAFAPPLFTNASNLLMGYGTGKVLFQLGMTAEYMAAYLNGIGKSTNEIIIATEPLINFIKRILFDSLVIRPITQDFFTADSTNRGICFWGDPQVSFTNSTLTPPYISNLGLEHQDASTAPDFGNAQYNDHVLQYGYYLQAAAFVVEWDTRFTNNTTDWWINQSVLGADGNLYRMWHYVDLLWRDTVNPFLEGDGGLPFMRSTNIWEGHGSAGGIQPIPIADIVSPTSPGTFMPTGLNLESVCEDYNTVLGAFRYVTQILNIASQLGLSSEQQSMYNYLNGAMLFNLKNRTNAARVLWYIIAQGYTDGITSETTPIYSPIYYNYSPTAGNVYDIQVNTNVAFGAGPQLPPVSCP